MIEQGRSIKEIVAKIWGSLIGHGAGKLDWAIYSALKDMHGQVWHI